MVEKLKPFDYFEPTDINEAIGILNKYGNKAKIIAGGLDLIPRMRHREINPEYLVCIQSIRGGNYIDENVSGGLRIGALTNLRSVEISPVVQDNYPVLYEAVHQIASVQVKTTGTMVGNLCVASPASDIAPALFVLDAKLKVAGYSSERVIPVDAFFIGVNQTSLKPGEVVTEILIPKLADSTGSAFYRLSWTTENIAKVNVAAIITLHENKCREIKIALGSVSPTPIRTKKAEDTLRGQQINLKIIEQAAQIASEEIQPITDIRATAEYRKEIAKVLVKRAIERAWQRVKK